MPQTMGRTIEKDTGFVNNTGRRRCLACSRACGMMRTITTGESTTSSLRKETVDHIRWANSPRLLAEKVVPHFADLMPDSRPTDLPPPALRTDAWRGDPGLDGLYPLVLQPLHEGFMITGLLQC